jgi:hypothetical protein
LPKTPDRKPGESLEEGTVYDNRPSGQDPTEDGGVRYVDGDFLFRDQFGVFNPRSTSNHDDLDTLVHNISEDSFDQVTRVGPRVTNITTWTDSGMTLKIREQQFSYTGPRLTQVVTIQYDGAGLEVMRLTEDITYVGLSARVATITRTETP